jgi:hypothetical protein
LFVRDVRGRLGDEHEGLLQAVQETLARLDRALDAVLLAVSGESQYTNSLGHE